MRWLSVCLLAARALAEAIDELSGGAKVVELYDTLQPLGARVGELQRRGSISIDLRNRLSASYSDNGGHDRLRSLLTRSRSRSRADVGPDDSSEEIYRVGTQDKTGLARLRTLPQSNAYEERITLHIDPRASQSAAQPDTSAAAPAQVDDLEIYHVSYRLVALPPTGKAVSEGAIEIRTIVSIDSLDAAGGASIDLVQRQRKAAASTSDGEEGTIVGAGGGAGIDGPEEVEEPPPPQTFFQKYGIYLLPVVLILLVNGGGGGGQ